MKTDKNTPGSVKLQDKGRQPGGFPCVYLYLATSHTARGMIIPARDIRPFRMEADFLEKGLAVANTVAAEVIDMLTAVWLMLSSLLYSLQLSTGSFPRPLTAQEEQYYLQLVAQGDLEARNVLIERNLRLVAHIMKKYYAQTSDQEDLISIGTIGLIKGITTFDASKGARLATYAARCVENAILT